MRTVRVSAECDRCGFAVEKEDAGYGILVALGSKTPVQADLCNACLELAHDALDKSIANGVRAGSNGHSNGNGRSRGNWGKREQVACPLCGKLISVGAGQVLHARKIHGQEKEDVWGLQTQAPA